MKIKNKQKYIYIKLTDKIFYIYDNSLIKIEAKYIKNGRVDDVNKLIIYLRKILNKNIIKYKYIFILDTLLNNSDLFTYKYVFNNIGLLNYKIINDLDLIKNELNNENIILLNWSSSINYCYLLNGNIRVYPFNSKIINNLKRKYILAIGDTLIPNNIKIPVYQYEDENLILFNIISNL